MRALIRQAIEMRKISEFDEIPIHKRDASEVTIMEEL